MSILGESNDNHTRYLMAMVRGKTSIKSIDISSQNFSGGNGCSNLTCEILFCLHGLIYVTSPCEIFYKGS